MKTFNTLNLGLVALAGAMGFTAAAQPAHAIVLRPVAPTPCAYALCRPPVPVARPLPHREREPGFNTPHATPPGFFQGIPVYRVR